jgi:flotillin
MGGILVGWLLLAITLIVAPIALSASGVEALSGFAMGIMILSGVVLLVLAGIVLIVTKLYVKTKAHEAIVRTGMGGRRVIMDGGAVVVPVIHEVVRVSLETIRLKVERTGASALLTQDKLRADIAAEFFVRVQPEEDQIIKASRSLGEKTANEGSVKGLIEDKLISALRTVAATKTLEELNSNREDFVTQVKESVVNDLAHNGFTLESATISALDQADTAALRDDNVFDAEGKLTIAAITEAKKTERNAIERERERERLEQDVRAREKMLKLEQERAEAEAKKNAEVLRIQAEQERTAEEARISKEQAVETAQLGKQKAIEVEQQRTAQAQAVAEQVKEQAVAVAKQEREQATEVAEQKRRVAVEQQRQVHAAAEADRLAAEKLREEQTQAVLTVTVVETAERDKRQQVLQAEATAEQAYVTSQRQADAAAYEMKCRADAEKAAAEAAAEAVRVKAKAEADAAKTRAEGEQAAQMVPVDVDAERVKIERDRARISVDVAEQQVKVDRERVDTVLKPELEARERSGQVAQEFELSKLRIEAEANVRIETAQAAAQIGDRIQAQLYGTPEDVSKMVQRLTQGMGARTLLDGFLGGANGNGNGVNPTHMLLSAVAEHLGVKSAKEVNEEGEGDAPPAVPLTAIGDTPTPPKKGGAAPTKAPAS